jgi:hypothetical protein
MTYARLMKNLTGMKGRLNITGEGAWPFRFLPAPGRRGRFTLTALMDATSNLGVTADEAGGED